jgi:hypothetical protein
MSCIWLPFHACSEVLMRMKQLFALAIAAFFLPALAALAAGPPIPSTITVTCESGGDATGCYEGFVTFTATGYPKHVNVVITDPDGNQYVYQSEVTTRGDFSFTSQFYVVGTWIIAAYDPRGRVDTLLDSEQFNIEP